MAPFEAGLHSAADVLRELDAKVEATSAHASTEFEAAAGSLTQVAGSSEQAATGVRELAIAGDQMAPLEGHVARVAEELAAVPAEAERSASAVVGGAEASGSAYTTMAEEIRRALSLLTAGSEEAAVAAHGLATAQEEAALRIERAQARLVGGTSGFIAGQREMGAASTTTAEIVERNAIAMAAAQGRVSAEAAAGALKQVASEEEVAAAILREVEAMKVRDAQMRASVALGTASASEHAKEMAAVEKGGLAGFLGGGGRAVAGTIGVFAAFEAGQKAVHEIIKLSKEAFHGAVDLGTGLNQADIVFGQFAHHVVGQTEELGHKFGFQNAQMLLFADGIGRIGKNFGLTTEQAADLAVEMESTVGAVARFKNQDPENVSIAFQRGILGMGKGLKALGVVLDENHLKQAALTLGLSENRDTWSSAELVQVRAKTIMMQLADVTDNLGKSQETLGGRIATLRGRFENFLEGIGHQAQPALLGILDGLGQIGEAGAPILANLAAVGGDVARMFVTVAREVGPLLEKLSALGGTVGIEALVKITDGLRVMFDWISHNRAATEAFVALVGLSMLPTLERVALTLGRLGKTVFIEPVIHSVQMLSRAIGSLLADSAFGPLRSIGEAFTRWGTAAETSAAKTTASGKEAAAGLEGTLGAELDALIERATMLNRELAATGPATGAGGAETLVAGAAGGKRPSGLLLPVGAEAEAMAPAVEKVGLLGGALTSARSSALALASAMPAIAAGAAGLGIVLLHANQIGDAIEGVARKIPLLNRAPGVSQGLNLDATKTKLLELGRAAERGDAKGIARINTELEKVANFDYQSVSTKAGNLAATLTGHLISSPHEDLGERLRGIDKAFSALASSGHPLEVRKDLEIFASSHGFPGVDALLDKLPKTSSALAAVDEAAKPTRDDLHKLADALQVPEDTVARWLEVADAIHLTPDALKKVSEQSGFTLEDISALAASGISDMEGLAASVQSMQDTFAQGVNPLTLVSKFATPLDFTGLDAQKSAAEKAGSASASGAGKSETAHLGAKKAVDAHTAALNRLTDAQKVLDRMRADPKTNPASLAAAEHRVEEAQRKVATSAEAASIAQGKVGEASHAAATKGDEWVLTAERIRTGYKNVLTNVQSFQSDMRTLVAKGLNPQTLVELMQMEPQQAASIAKAILSDTSKTTIDTINLVSGAMNQLITQHARFSQLEAVAIGHADKPDAAKFAAELPAAQQVVALQQQKPAITAEEIEQKLGIDATTMKQVAEDYKLNIAGLDRVARDEMRKVDPAKALKPDLHAAAFEALGGRTLPQAAGDVIENTARIMISKNATAGRRAWDDFERQFGPDQALPVMREIAAKLRAEGHVEAALKIEGLIDEKVMQAESRKAAAAVAKDFGFNLGSKGEEIVRALGDSIADHAPAMALKAQQDLVAAFGQAKADAVVNDMIGRLRIAGRLLEAAELDYQFHPAVDVRPPVVTLPDGSKHRLGVAGGKASFALGGYEPGDAAGHHQPEFAGPGPTRVWREPETRGETYLPHADDHRRPAARRYLQQTAELFGMVALDKRELVARLDRDTVRLADGGILTSPSTSRVASPAGAPHSVDRGTAATAGASAAGHDRLETRTLARLAAASPASVRPPLAGAGASLADSSSATLRARPEVATGPGAGEGKAARFAQGGVTFSNAGEVARTIRDGLGRMPEVQSIVGEYAGGVTNKFVQDVEKLRAAAAAGAPPAGPPGGGKGAALPGAVQLWINAALGITGTGQDWFPTLTYLVSRESGGNPRALNATPVGPRKEHAAGLFQMLPSTFRAHALPGYGDIWNPIDNAISAIGYIKGRYGSPARIPHLYDSKYVGYALGGVVGDHLVHPRPGGVLLDLPLGRVEHGRALAGGRGAAADGDERGALPTRDPRGDVVEVADIERTARPRTPFLARLLRLGPGGVGERAERVVRTERADARPARGDPGLALEAAADRGGEAAVAVGGVAALGGELSGPGARRQVMALHHRERVALRAKDDLPALGAHALLPRRDGAPSARPGAHVVAVGGEGLHQGRLAQRAPHPLDALRLPGLRARELDHDPGAAVDVGQRQADVLLAHPSDTTRAYYASGGVVGSFLRFLAGAGHKSSGDSRPRGMLEPPALAIHRPAHSIIITAPSSGFPAGWAVVAPWHGSTRASVDRYTRSNRRHHYGVFRSRREAEEYVRMIAQREPPPDHAVAGGKRSFAEGGTVEARGAGERDLPESRSAGGASGWLTPGRSAGAPDLPAPSLGWGRSPTNARGPAEVGGRTGRGDPPDTARPPQLSPVAPAFGLPPSAATAAPRDSSGALRANPAIDTWAWIAPSTHVSVGRTPPSTEGRLGAPFPAAYAPAVERQVQADRGHPEPAQAMLRAVYRLADEGGPAARAHVPVPTLRLAGGALLDQRATSTTSTSGRAELPPPLSAPSTEQFRAAAALLGPVARKLDQQAKLGDPLVGLRTADHSAVERPRRLVPEDGDGKRLPVDRLQHFERGGVVGGRRGEPQLAVVHGGEVVSHGSSSSVVVNIDMPLHVGRVDKASLEDVQHLVDEGGRKVKQSVIGAFQKIRRPV